MQVHERLRRLLAILPWLAERGEATIEEVARRFGMSEQQVVADLELAACCGLPPYTPDTLIELIVSEGSVSASFGPTIARPMRLTPAEGFTLAASARAILAVPGPDSEGALARALRKLEAVLGPGGGVEVAVQGAEEAPWLDRLRRAARDGEAVEIEYHSASRDEVTRRVVEPEPPFSSEGRWYFEAYCHLAGDRRRFRADRVLGAVSSGRHFEPLAATASQPGPSFAPGPEAREVTLLLPPAARWVSEAYSTVSVEELPDGWQRLVIAFGGEAWLERLLLRMGPEGRVIGPEDLVGLGRRAAARVLSLYEAAGGEPAGSGVEPAGSGRAPAGR